MSDAHAPAAYTEETVNAFMALQAGKASEGQQKACLDWVINQAARLYDMSYRADDTHATAFAEGRRFVGNQVVKMMRIETLKAAKAAKAAASEGTARHRRRGAAEARGKND
ncbi:hypothetical protein GOZ96_04755 [Agrobacterium vitis]|uniref:Uncharacterized protein n=1 Tax=Agrobacterium vitis TaxID=373 RepID=A0A7J4X4S6_AGRVI|nr:hypothetical protein [Agrobacterium vitis]KAA3527054.1 hypothetical protein DXT89_14055 [Agrobacterium vitis]MUZ95899.1 hypothetical protein [Agrobacterium vitis]